MFELCCGAYTPHVHTRRWPYDIYHAIFTLCQKNTNKVCAERYVLLCVCEWYDCGRIVLSIVEFNINSSHIHIW